MQLLHPARVRGGWRVSGSRGAALTPSQLLVWLGATRHPDAPIYNMVTTFRLAGPLDATAFAQAWAAVIAEADALRSVFVDAGGVPRRRVLDDVGDALDDVVDLSGAAHPETALAAWLAARDRRVLDIATRCFDAALVKIGPASFVWYLDQHHLVADAWSTRLVFERTAAHYRRLMTGAAVDAPPPPFEDYAAELGERIDSPRNAAALAHWRQLAQHADAGEPPALYGRTLAASATASERVTVQLGTTRTRALETLIAEPAVRALNRDVTLFQVFATVTFALLHRASGQTRLLLGAPAMNRTTPRQRRTIGLVMEMFALGVEVAAGDSLAALYAKVREQTMSFLRHGRAGTGNARLIRNFAALLNFVPGVFPDFAGLPTEVEFRHAGAVEPHNALRVQVRDLAGSGALAVDFDFNEQAVPAPLRAIVTEQFLRLLDAFIDDRERALGALDLIGAGARERLLHTLNDNATPYPQLPLHGLFELAAAARPDQAAVTHENRTLTYAELEGRANGLARALADRGVGAGERVALVLERGVDVVLGMLAALKAGAAYLPIDTELPAARRALLLEQGRPAAILWDGSVALPSAVEDALPPVLRIETIASHERPPGAGRRTGLDDPAYVLFTSGSTGTPKGVVCRHRGVVNLIADFERRRALGAGDPCSLWTGVGFDVSVWEIFAALTQGGTLHVVPTHLRSDARRLFDWMCEQAIASAYLPPFMLEDFCRWSEAAPGRLRLTRILVGVEPIPQRVLAGLMRALPGLHVVNGYGPTETTICASFYSVPAAPCEDRRTPIGSALQNNRLYVLDPFGQPAPFGVPGELFVGGHGVALGYLDNPALTAERFVPDPFAPDGGRMYRTGDRVRYLDDGTLEFLGRVDHQIKIRGHRVEPGEIERALTRFADVREALVVARELPGRGRALVAYLVPDETSGGTAESGSAAWFERLRPLLPAYMIPAAYVTLACLPQTPSGKVDRGALPAPAAASDARRSASRAPQTAAERALAAIWCEVLGHAAVGAEEHFIDLGGESIQALQITARAREAGLIFTPGELFEHPTVAALACRARTGETPPGQRRAAGTAQLGAPSGLAEAAARAGLGADDLDDLLAEFGEGPDA